MKSCFVLSVFLVALCSGAFTLVAQDQASEAAVTMDLIQQGSYYYLERDYKRAIPPYRTALEREKTKRLIDKKFWIVLVDNLGMAYGISGDLEKARETFEYGLSKDEDYPLFYYNLACTYGEMDKMEKAIEYLKLAFERKDKMLPGERFPNPATDSSFQRFMNNEKFVQALKDMNK